MSGLDWFASRERIFGGAGGWTGLKWSFWQAPTEPQREKHYQATRPVLLHCRFVFSMIPVARGLYGNIRLGSSSTARLTSISKYKGARERQKKNTLGN